MEFCVFSGHVEFILKSSIESVCEPTDVESGENITELMVSEGWLSVRAESLRGDSSLAALEEQAKAAKKVGCRVCVLHGIFWKVQSLVVLSFI